MTKSALQVLRDTVDLLEDEIGDGTLVIDRTPGRSYALVSTDYLEALERKADAYDDLTRDPEAAAAERKDLIARMTSRDE